MEKYKNKEGKIGVLVSGDYGAGWSTWHNNSTFLAMDKELVAMKIKNTPIEEVEAYCLKINGKAPYMGGWDDAEIAWVEEGFRFTIEEYDGSESLRSIDDLSIMEA